MDANKKPKRENPIPSIGPALGESNYSKYQIRFLQSFGMPLIEIYEEIFTIQDGYWHIIVWGIKEKEL